MLKIKMLLISIICLFTSIGVNSTEKNQITAVLVHGVFADGSSWNKVVPLLQKAGIKTISVQLPLTSLHEDAEFTRRAIEQASGPVVLVGHSWGGMVITEAGVNEKVKSLVYISAFAPSTAEHLYDVLTEAHGVNKIPKVPGLANPIKDKYGYMSLSEADILKHFAPDLPASEAKLIAASQGKFHQGELLQRITKAAWKDKPSWFVISQNDQMIAPDLMRLHAKKIGAIASEVEASHVVMLSKPNHVAKVIVEAANAK